LGSARVRALALATLVIGSFLSAATASAAIPPGSGGLNDSRDPSEDPPGAAVVDCQPGFATAHDRIAVYPRGGEARATESVELSAAVQNQGHADAHASRLTFLAGRDRGTMGAVGSAVVDVPGDAAVRARLIWIPPAGGDWLIQARVDGTDGAGPMAGARVSASADLDPAAVLAAQDVPAGLLIGAAVLLMIGAVLAATIGSGLWRP
jgi:hypothetical protein